MPLQSAIPLEPLKPIRITCGNGVRRFRAVLDATGVSQKSRDFLAFCMNQKQRYVSGCQLLDHPSSAVGRTVGKDDPVRWQAEVEAFLADKTGDLTGRPAA